MAYLKSDAPPEVIEALRQAEAQADECWRGLQIRHYPSNLAVWAVLTGGIRVVEREQAARGSNTAHFDAMLANLSRLLAVAVKWAMGHGQPFVIRRVITLRARLFFPRLMSSKVELSRERCRGLHRVGSPSGGSSILIISAPRFARIMLAYGPGSIRVRSTTLVPSSALGMRFYYHCRREKTYGNLHRLRIGARAQSAA